MYQYDKIIPTYFLVLTLFSRFVVVEISLFAQHAGNQIFLNCRENSRTLYSSLRDNFCPAQQRKLIFREYNFYFMIAIFVNQKRSNFDNVFLRSAQNQTHQIQDSELPPKE